MSFGDLTPPIAILRAAFLFSLAIDLYFKLRTLKFSYVFPLLVASKTLDYKKFLGRIRPTIS